MRKGRGIALLLAALVFVAACGHKAPPVPPSDNPKPKKTDKSSN